MFVFVLYIFILLKTTEYYFWKAVVQLENKREWSLQCTDSHNKSVIQASCHGLIYV